MARLAEEIIIHLAGEAIELRPSLRHAIRLERRPGSFAGLLREIDEGSLTAALDIIRPHHDDEFLANRAFDALGQLKEPLTLYVLALAGIDPDDDASRARAPRAKGKERPTQTFADHLAQLYRIGTGWLGWTPDVTLDATPAEIMEAHKGRVELLRSIFGSDDEPESHDDRPLDEKFREVFASFGTVKMKREAA